MMVLVVNGTRRSRGGFGRSSYVLALEVFQRVHEDLHVVSVSDSVRSGEGLVALIVRVLWMPL